MVNVSDGKIKMEGPLKLSLDSKTGELNLSVLFECNARDFLSGIDEALGEGILEKMQVEGLLNEHYNLGRTPSMRHQVSEEDSGCDSVPEGLSEFLDSMLAASSSVDDVTLVEDILSVVNSLLSHYDGEAVLSVDDKKSKRVGNVSQEYGHVVVTVPHSAYVEHRIEHVLSGMGIDERQGPLGDGEIPVYMSIVLVTEPQSVMDFLSRSQIAAIVDDEVHSVHGFHLSINDKEGNEMVDDTRTSFLYLLEACEYSIYGLYPDSDGVI